MKFREESKAKAGKEEIQAKEASRAKAKAKIGVYSGEESTSKEEVSKAKRKKAQTKKEEPEKIKI